MTETVQLRLPALPRTQVLRGAIDEYERFAELIAGLDDQAWTRPTRCEGWAVRDVAAHVAESAADVIAGTIGQRTADQEAAAGRGRTPTEQAAFLRSTLTAFTRLAGALDDAAWQAASPVAGMSIGKGVLTIWFDTYIHADDIRHAVGLPSVHGDGLRASLEYVRLELEERGWGPARIEVDDQPVIEVGSGAGPAIRGDALEFLLVGTGRLDPGRFGLDETVNVFRAT